MLRSKSAVLFALCAGTAVAVVIGGPVQSPLSGVFFGHPAFAQEDGGNGGSGGEGGQGQGNQGSQNGQGNQGGEGQGQGGPSEDSDGQGPQAGGPSDSGGGKPVWAQEGIPEVELGRLSVARSPDQVLDRALDEAVAGLTPEMIDYYNSSLSEAIEQLSLQFDDTAFIDSPLQNLALLKDLLSGNSALTAQGVSNDTLTLAAMLLGAASDKTIPITVETVIAVTTILEVPVSPEFAAQLAAAAEAIRIAILAGHG